MLKDSKQLLKAIAFQLALNLEDYRNRLLHKLHLHANSSDEYCNNVSNQLENRNTQDIFLSILAEPMAGLWRAHKVVVLIDALDETTDEKGNNRIADLIGNELSNLPEWISFVLTSRPEVEIINRLNGFKPLLINGKDPLNQADLCSWYKEYIATRTELQQLAPVRQQQIEKLVIESSGGMVLYLRLVEEGFQEGSLTIASLNSLESGLPGLNRRYYDSFQHRFGSDYETTVKPLLRLLLAAGGSLPENLACEVLGWNSEQFIACRSRLGSYMLETESGYELFHQTIFDWLSHSSSGQFHLDRTLGRQLLAEVLFKEIADKEIHLVRWQKQIQEWLPAWLAQLSQYNDLLILVRLGTILSKLGNYSTARPLLERAVASSENSWGSESIATAYCLNQLAMLLKNQGDYAAAIPISRHALAVIENEYGIEHPETAKMLNNLAHCLKLQGDYAGAEPLYRRALAICDKKTNTDQSSTAISIDNLASIMHQLGDYVGAEPLYRRALAIREKTLGLEHPDTAVSLGNLADLLESKGDYAAAGSMYRRALAINETALGLNHPLTALGLNNLAEFLRSQGAYVEAEPLYRRALAIYEQTIGLDHWQTATILCNLAVLLESQGNFAEAEPLHRSALAIREKTLGSEHPLTAGSLNNLAEFLRKQGAYAEAEPLYRRALAIHMKVFGSEHPNTAIILNRSLTSTKF